MADRPVRAMILHQPGTSDARVAGRRRHDRGPEAKPLASEHPGDDDVVTEPEARTSHMAGSRLGESDMDDAGASSANDGITLRVSERVHEVAGRGTALLEDLRSRVTAIDIAVRIQERDKHAAGIAVASVSFVAVAALYVVLWSVLYLTLPRRHERPRRRPAGRSGRGGGADRTPGGHAAVLAPPDRECVGDLRHGGRRHRDPRVVLHPRSGDGVLVRRQRSVVRTTRQCLDLRIRAPRSPTHPASVPESRPLLRSRRTRWPCMNNSVGDAVSVRNLIYDAGLAACQPAPVLSRHRSSNAKQRRLQDGTRIQTT